MKDFFEYRLTEASRKKPVEKSAKLSAEWKSEPPEDKSLDSIFLSGRGYELDDPYDWIEWALEEEGEDDESDEFGPVIDNFGAMRSSLRNSCGEVKKYKSKHYKDKLEIQVGSYEPDSMWGFESNSYPIGIFVNGRKVTWTADANVAASLVLRQTKNGEIKKSVLMKIGPYLERKIFERDKKIVKMYKLKFD